MTMLLVIWQYRSGYADQACKPKWAQAEHHNDTKRGKIVNNILDRERLLRSTILAGFAAVGLSISPAMAQAQNNDQDEESEEAEETIVVTGSRINRSSFTSVAPLQVIDSAEIRDAGLIDTAQILQTSSVAQGVQLDNTIGGAFVTDAGPGANTITLRGLNPDQTLLLINGRRVGPSGVEGAPALVNVDIIPTDVIQRIDILLDGASSVYGSDAVAGVVNVVLRDEFEGFQVGTFITSPEQEGGGSHRWSVMMGDSSENGSFMFAAEYQHQDALKVNQRDWNYDPADGLYCSRDLEIATDGSLLSECEGSIINRVRLFTYYVDGNPDLASYFAHPGLWQRDVYSSPGTTNLPGNLPVGWSTGASTDEAYRSSYLDQTTDIVPDAQRYSLMFTGDYTMDRFLGQENVRAFVELLHNNSQAAYKSGYHGQIFPDVSASNPFNPFGYDAVPIFASPIERSNISTEIQYTRLMMGLQGDWGFAPSWSYEVFAGYTRSMGYSSRPQVDESRLRESIATSRIDPGTGDVICGYDTTDYALFGFLDPTDCVPVNLFAASLYPNDGTSSPHFSTQEEYDFLRIDRTATTTVDQMIFGGFTTGPLFNVPAGEVQGVFGMEWRRDSLDSGTDTVASQGRAAGYFADRRSVGSAELTEYYGELSVPLINGRRFFEDVSLELAGRLTDHEYYGQNSTYSARLGWQVNDFLTFNGTIGTSFRAPNLRELFLGGQTGFSSGYADPCVVPLAANTGGTYVAADDNRDAQVLANCVSEGVDPTSLGLGGVSSIESFRAGNPGLDPETSDAYSFGFVFEQPFTDAFDASIRVSYFSVEVEDSIAIPSTAFSLAQCYNSTNFPNDPFCARRERSTDTGTLLFVDNTPFNVATQTTNGWDFNTRFNKDFDIFGGFNLDVNSTFTRSEEVLNQTTSESDILNFVGDWGTPEVRGSVNTRVTRGDWGMLWRARYLGEQASISNVVGTNYGERLQAASELGGDAIDSADSVWYHDLSVSLDRDTWSLSVGVNNLLDDAPALADQDASGATLGTGNELLGSGYDIIGRRVFVNVRKRW
ncbi:TonB-dependent receptor [uncultured Maricaulis sp.]|uniref:TonB-dependent receptor plug domain-containing protein n=1 Tax=uncultured Maricaulis sp. TaxID=174710 RepID=UPI0030D796FD|tara:strand:+ start:11063 stop:14227 length:3165 start_codon:yes stop_codon:yes gene_type:complete